MSLTLTNRSGRCLALNLPHDRVCTPTRCFCVTRPGRPATRIAGSITLPAGHARTDLPEALLALPEVRALVRRGDLEVRVVHDPSPAPTSAQPPETPAQAEAAEAADVTSTKRARRKRGESR